MSMALIAATRELSRRVDALRFSAPVTHVYNPLDYARAPHELYLNKYGSGQKRVIFLGMNPGPFGMVQTGVPFGEVAVAKGWLACEALVNKPDDETMKRPIEGFDCARSEVSGRRLWGFFAARYEKPEHFFKDHLVMNYCPLAFLENARNVTPDKLPLHERTPLYAACDDYLREVVKITKAEWVVGIGKFARQQAEKTLGGQNLKFGDILHPSPASPAANRGWDAQAQKQLVEMGLLAA
jgi:single-strand selective monofunctional uracil DNA glycosylase